MNKNLRRQRTVLRIRWREKNLGGVSSREYEILQETKLYRTLREMFPEAQKWQVHSAIRSMSYGRVVAKMRSEQVVYRGKRDHAIHREAFRKSYGRGHTSAFVIIDEIPHLMLMGEEARNIPFSKMVDGRRENVMLTRSEWERERERLGNEQGTS